MEIYIKIKNHLFNTFNQINLGITITEFLLIFFCFVITLLTRKYFANFILIKIKKLFKNPENEVNNNLFDNLAPPLKFLPFIFIFLLIGLFSNTDSQLGLLIKKINQTLLTIFIFWTLYQSLMPLSQTFQKIEKLLSKALIQWLIKSFKYLIFFLGAVAVLDIWGIKVGPVIAGLGLFGVAVALGAQDLFKNLISGIMIIVEKRFELNDVIEIQGHATGTVEHIGFRSTLIRQFDSTPISIPNYVFSDKPIINFSQRHFRRINWIIGLTYDTTIKQLKEICRDIETFIRSNDNFIINETFRLNVKVEKFNDSSIDVLINTFTNTNEWEKYLLIREELAFIIKEIIEKNQSSFAFPSRSIYLEKNLD
tara:strand:- start:113 stop:1210 length:1098 start_codon:yes stop_codon:yes gene_type:complete